eukprot:438889_1
MLVIDLNNNNKYRTMGTRYKGRWIDTSDINKLRTFSESDFAMKAWGRAVNGVVLTDLSSNLYANISVNSNIFHPNKLIMGFNSMDGTSEQKSAPENAREYDEYISKYITNETQINLIENVYYPLSEYIAFEKYPAASVAWLV